VFGAAFFIPRAGDVFGNPFLISHFHTAQVPILYETSRHVKAIRLILAHREVAPGQEIGGTTDGAPLFIKGSYRQHIRKINIVNEFLGFLGNV